MKREIQKFYATRPGVLVKIAPVSVPAEVHHG